MEAARVIGILLAFAAAIMAVLSLISPKAALLNKHKTRLKGMLTWLGLAVAITVGTMLIFPLTPEELSAQQAKRAARDNGQAEEQRPATAVALLPYTQESVDATSTARRKRGRVKIYLADPTAHVTPEALTATCMAAAKHYAAAYGFQALSVFLADMPGGNGWEGTRLAQCSYSPDKGGWSGSQGWLWEQIMAAPRGLTDQERRIKKLWGELRGKYQKDGGTDEDALKSAIAKKMNIKPDQVTLLWFMLDKVSAGQFEDVAPQGPAEPKAAATTSVAPTENEVRAQVRELLAELDSFKNSDVFRQCVYGCGSKGPGSAWNTKRKALQDQMTPQLDVPILLKAAPGELWMLGMAYAKGKADEARELRAEIEKALAQ